MRTQLPNPTLQLPIGPAQLVNLAMQPPSAPVRLASPFARVTEVARQLPNPVMQLSNAPTQVPDGAMQPPSRRCGCRACLCN